MTRQLPPEQPVSGPPQSVATVASLHSMQLPPAVQRPVPGPRKPEHTASVGVITTPPEPSHVRARQSPEVATPSTNPLGRCRSRHARAPSHSSAWLQAVSGAPHAVPAGRGSVVTLPPEQMGRSQPPPSSAGTSPSSATSSNPPLPSHWLARQSPAAETTRAPGDRWFELQLPWPSQESALLQAVVAGSPQGVPWTRNAIDGSPLLQMGNAQPRPSSSAPASGVHMEPSPGPSSPASPESDPRAPPLPPPRGPPAPTAPPTPPVSMPSLPASPPAPPVSPAAPARFSEPSGEPTAGSNTYSPSSMTSEHAATSSPPSGAIEGVNILRTR